MQPNTVRGSEWRKENHHMFVSHCAEMSCSIKMVNTEILISHAHEIPVLMQ